MENNKKMNNKNSHTAARAAQGSVKKSSSEDIHMLNFSKVNYILLVAGIVVLAIGYLLLSGGGSDDPNVFNYDMFNSRRLVVAPIVIVCGLLLEIAAIMLRPRQKENTKVGDEQ